MIMDPMLRNIGYRLGRLFATLEKIEVESNPGVESTLRRINYGMAMSRPLTVFKDMITASKDQLSKIQDEELRAKLEKLLAEITEGLNEFPSFLNYDDQSLFAGGYNKQTQNFKDGIFE
jgi:CRISPR-associated protein Csd1